MASCRLHLVVVEHLWQEPHQRGLAAPARTSWGPSPVRFCATASSRETEQPCARPQITSPTQASSLQTLQGHDRVRKLPVPALLSLLSCPAGCLSTAICFVVSGPALPDSHTSPRLMLRVSGAEPVDQPHTHTHTHTPQTRTLTLTQKKNQAWGTGGSESKASASPHRPSRDCQTLW